MNNQANFIESVLAIVARKLNIQKWRYESKHLSGNIVNYVGNLVPVDLIDESSNATQHLMIKADTSALVPEIEPIAGGAYRREVYFYSSVVPLFECYTNNSEGFFPECYYADSMKGSRVLALQDMTFKGFKRHDKGRFLDSDHIILTLEAVAKLHSFSLILKEKNIKLLDNEVLAPFSTWNEPQYANGIKKCFKKYGVQLFKGTKHEEFIKKVYSTMSDMTQFMDHCVTDANALVYGHGDMWKENFLFKYSNDKPTQVCLLDYQLCHLMSPARDVLFLIMNSTDSYTRRHYLTFLSAYYNALEHSLKTNGLDPSKVYPKQQFDDDLKLVFPISFGITLFSYALWLGFENLISLLDSTGTVNVETQKYNVDLLLKIIGDIVTDFSEFGVTPY